MPLLSSFLIGVSSTRDDKTRCCVCDKPVRAPEGTKRQTYLEFKPNTASKKKFPICIYCVVTPTMAALADNKLSRYRKLLGARMVEELKAINQEV